MKMKKIIITLLLILALAGTAQAALTDGLIAYWPLDETTGLTYADDICDMNNFIMTPNPGGTIANRTTTGKINAALRDSYNEFRSVAGNNGIQGLTAETVAFWIKLYGTLSMTEDFKLQNLGFGDGYWTGWQIVVGTMIWPIDPDIYQSGLFFAAGGNAVDDDPALWCVYAPYTALQGGDWRLVVITFDSNASPMGKIYINNVSADSLHRGAAILPLTSNAVVYVSPYITGGGGETHCSVDEIAVWNRVLTEQERNDLWNNGNGTQLLSGSVALINGRGVIDED